MPVSIRRVAVDDLLQLQDANLQCLAENYHMWYWLYHFFLSPQAAHCAVSGRGKVLGYVLGKLDEESRKAKPVPPPRGAITSVAVLGRYRKLGFATKLLSLTHATLRSCFNAESVRLHVRETNRAGQRLYRETIGYQFVNVENNYYADGEHAWALRYTYPPKS
jgi:peptide alpha-N-acetyltransferase